LNVQFLLYFIQNLLGLAFWTGRSITGTWLLMMIACLGFLPGVSATSNQSPFPNLTFQVFAQFIADNFSSKISLTTVLTVLFTMTNNSDLINLHNRQQQALVEGENNRVMTGWMIALSRALQEKIGDDSKRLFHASEQHSSQPPSNAIGIKLAALSRLLWSFPDSQQNKLKEVSTKEIEPALVICPASTECETVACKQRSLLQETRARDIPRTTLIKGITIYDGVYVLCGRCPGCDTIYYADHESSWQKEDRQSRIRFYLNSAKYLKIGQALWVDRVFSGAVLSGTYSFHASSSALAQFWNHSFWKSQNSQSRKVSRRQMWHAFVQESIRRVADSSGCTLELLDGLPIEDITKHAFIFLGENGVVRSAQNHFCSECTHHYRTNADRITRDDPAALLGVDENRTVPVLTGEDADLAAQDAAQARYVAETAMDVDQASTLEHESEAPVKMVVLDGIVMGHTHCSYDDCTQDLANVQRGVFCVEHEILRQGLCRMKDCNNLKIADCQTCEQHQNRWYSHVVRYGRQSLLGIRRLLRRTEEEHLAWLPNVNHQVQPHDEDQNTQRRQRDNFFVAPRFYCVETICAPCGVVIAWAKFARAESPTAILNFLASVYPTEELRPNYICIDKACLVLRTAISNGSWEVWKKTSRFIVDSYHYINHRTTDYLCRKWCNPAPLNGSAPNLVVVENDKAGNPHYKRAFNTQV
jgi:hypothetical protein